MIAEAGHYALVLALGLALIQAVVPIAGARLHDPAPMNVARSTAIAQMAFALGSFGTLVALHVTSDFSVANVYENSHSLKPLIYNVNGVWGNHEGSMLLWVLILALFGGLVAAFGNNLPLSLRAQEQRAHRFDEGRRRRLDRRVHRNPRRHRPAAGTDYREMVGRFVTRLDDGRLVGVIRRRNGISPPAVRRRRKRRC
jgi:hypothetical protein